MLFRICFLFYKLRFVYSGALVVIAALLIIAAAAPRPGTAQTQNIPAPANMAALGVSDSPNAVAAAMTMAAYKVTLAVDATGRATRNGVQSVASAISHSCNAVGHGIQHGTVATLRGIGSGIMFVVHIPGHTVRFVTHGAVVNAIIKPADHNPVPIIDPQSPALLAAKVALPATQTNPEPNTEAAWPIHGQITTPFGVPEWPYQAVHTGLDISDGNYRGTTPITAFRQGRVIDIERLGGLGNHVVIDHGSGVTSVYGHLASISVQVGQDVTTGTIVGYEGSTGVSTGPHLHFEIRVNGQATDPHQFISGQP